MGEAIEKSRITAAPFWLFTKEARQDPAAAVSSSPDDGDVVKPGQSLSPPRKGQYVQFALGENQVDPNVEQHYQAVDPNGVVNLGYYDLLVLRARYSHTLQRTVVLPDAGPASGGKGSAGEGSPKVSTTIIENQTRAHERFANFNSQFAEFVRRVDPSMVLVRAPTLIAAPLV